MGSRSVPVGIVAVASSRRVREGGAISVLASGAAMRPVALTWLMI